jgi:hypothetical protein
MSIEFKANHKDGALDLVIDGRTIASLSPDEALKLFKQTDRIFTENAHIFKASTHYQITKEKLHKCKIDTASLIRIRFDYTNHVNCFPEAFVGVNFFASSHSFDDNLTDNFTPQQLYFGPITNHHLRSCLSDEIIDELLDFPNLEIYVNHEQIDSYVFFNEFQTVYFEPHISYDT